MVVLVPKSAQTGALRDQFVKNRSLQWLSKSLFFKSWAILASRTHLFGAENLDEGFPIIGSGIK
jgi:hypothetical protein